MTSPRNRGNGAGIKFLRDHIRHDGDGCLIWPLNRDTSGYGILSFEGKLSKASILMCTLAHGPRPPRHNAAFSCGRGSKGCVHPGHLSWKTHKETMQIAAARGSIGKKRGRPRATLNERDVAKIKILKGTATYAEIGALFGVKHKQIGRVIRSEHWIDGKQGRGGFAPGDPRNPFAGANSGRLIVRKRRPRVQLAPPISLAYPYVSRVRDEHADLLFVNSIVPRSLPDHMRADICQEMLLALIEGRATRESLLANHAADFRRAFYRDNYEQAGRAKSFDDFAFALTENGWQ